MSEFDKLMSGGSQRKDVKQRQENREQSRLILLACLAITFFMSLIPPHYGVIVFLPILIITIIYSWREWIC